MTPKTSHIFEHHGQTYEVRAWPTIDGHLVQCFHRNTPVGLKYSVSYETADDFALYHGSSAIEALIQIAESSVRDALDRGDPVD